MSREPTPEQKKIIDARGRIIVSASAGSGKTYVMIERLISFLLGKEDVRGMLAVTFTNNAAAQMRDRLRTALLKAIAAETGSTRDRLKEQLAALPLAEISTVHAFCGRLVRTYFYRAGVDPAFRIIDAEGAEGMELSARAMDAALEKAYKAPSEGFSLLLSVFYAKGNDSALRKHILSLYDFVRDFNDYRSVIGQMGHTSFDAVCDFLAEDVRSRVKELARIQDVWRDTLYCYSENLVEVTDQIVADAEAASQGGLFGQCAAWSAMNVVKRSTKKGDSIPKKDCTPEQEKAIEYYETFRSAATAIRARLSAIGPREEEEARFASACRIAAAFGELLLSYDAEYTREKQEAGVLDYSDLEQYALTILEDPDIEKDVRERYRILFVDEYQDINPVQAAILSHLAGEEVFYVGDAKQAIYGFRGSSSEFFTQKTHELEQCYPLSQNFRSAENILRAVNAVFEPILATYEPMSGGTRYKEHKGDVCIHVLAKAGKAEAPVGRGVYSVLEHPAEGKRDLFAERVALLVERELRSVWYDVDAACEKAVKPGDIAVLCRSHKGEARLAHALLARGIPVTTSAKINICDFFEARLLLDWLSYLDNPAQDIPYVTALLSFVGGMTEAELAEIRAASDKGTTFRAACQTFRKRNAASPVAKKLAAFEERTKELRIHACVRTAADVMNELLALGLEVQIAAKEGGPDRLVRVRRLVAEGENVSVSAFLARLRAAGNRLDFAPSSGADAVQVITIHASKGLEYPVVFLTDMNHAFQFPDDKQEIIKTKEYLAAPRSYDTEKKTYSGNLLRLASITAQTARERMEGVQPFVCGDDARQIPPAHFARKRKSAENFRRQWQGRMRDFLTESVCSRGLSGKRTFPPKRPNAGRSSIGPTRRWSGRCWTSTASPMRLPRVRACAPKARRPICSTRRRGSSSRRGGGERALRHGRTVSRRDEQGGGHCVPSLLAARPLRTGCGGGTCAHGARGCLFARAAGAAAGGGAARDPCASLSQGACREAGCCASRPSFCACPPRRSRRARLPTR